MTQEGEIVLTMLDANESHKAICSANQLTLPLLAYMDSFCQQASYGVGLLSFCLCLRKVRRSKFKRLDDFVKKPS